MKMNHIGFQFFVLMILMACGTKKNEVQNKTPDERNKNKGTFIISAPIVEKTRLWKGEKTEETDLYVQRSVADYFIKFCDSKVTREEVNNELSLQKGLIKTLKIEVECLDGEWDNSQEKQEEKVASRTGEYVIIHKIIR